jgi:hypothetical protein
MYSHTRSGMTFRHRTQQDNTRYQNASTVLPAVPEHPGSPSDKTAWWDALPKSRSYKSLLSMYNSRNFDVDAALSGWDGRTDKQKRNIVTILFTSWKLLEGIRKHNIKSMTAERNKLGTQNTELAEQVNLLSDRTNELFENNLELCIINHRSGESSEALGNINKQLHLKLCESESYVTRQSNILKKLYVVIVLYSIWVAYSMLG